MVFPPKREKGSLLLSLLKPKKNFGFLLRGGFFFLYPVKGAQLGVWGVWRVIGKGGAKKPKRVLPFLQVFFFPAFIEKKIFLPPNTQGGLWEYLFGWEKKFPPGAIDFVYRFFEFCFSAGDFFSKIKRGGKRVFFFFFFFPEWWTKGFGSIDFCSGVLGGGKGPNFLAPKKNPLAGGLNGVWKNKTLFLLKLFEFCKKKQRKFFLGGGAKAWERKKLYNKKTSKNIESFKKIGFFQKIKGGKKDQRGFFFGFSPRGLRRWGALAGPPKGFLTGGPYGRFGANPAFSKPGALLGGGNPPKGFPKKCWVVWA